MFGTRFEHTLVETFQRDRRARNFVANSRDYVWIFFDRVLYPPYTTSHYLMKSSCFYVVVLTTFGHAWDESVSAENMEVPDQSRMPFSGIQFERPITTRHDNYAIFGKKLIKSDRSMSLIRRLESRAAHLHEEPPQGTAVPLPVPDVFVCFIPSGQNGLSVRACDLAGNTAAVLSQKLACSVRQHPRTIADVLMGSQKSPIDLTGDESSAVESLKSMATPVSLQITFGSCDLPREDLPDSDLNLDYLVFVMANPLVELAAENAPGNKRAFKAGLVMVDVKAPSELKKKIATNFMNDVETCANDGSCTAAELAGWVPSGAQQVDWFVGRSDGLARILLEPQTKVLVK